MSEKVKILRVTITKDYYIPMANDEQSKINGWTIDEIIEDWFKKGMYGYHATRDSSEIGGSTKFISSEIHEIGK